MQGIDTMEAVTVKTVSETDKVGVFEMEGLYRGYGLTLGAALRRVLISSLPGAAITRVKIKNVGHEFSTIPGVLEDVVEITLNLKKVRFRMHINDPQVLTLKVKREGPVTAGDIKGTADIEVITPDVHIATITAKGTEIDVELTVEKGLGYVPVEARKTEKLPIGVIDLDAIFSPVMNVNFVTENMRVGDRTDYNRSKVTIETDGSITPSQALREACGILQSLFAKVSGIEVRELAPIPPKEESAPGAAEGGTEKKKTSKTRTRSKKKSE